MGISSKEEKKYKAKLIQEQDILFDKLYQFIPFTNNYTPTIYDEIRNLQGIDLHNRLVFEFSIRNKNNQKYITKIIEYYNDNKINLEKYKEQIKCIDNSITYQSLVCDYEESPHYDQRFTYYDRVFHILIERLNKIEFLPFNSYDIDSKYRHQLISPDLYEIMNEMYELRELFAKNTQEIQLDKKIDGNTTEYIGKTGFNMRLEKNYISDFSIEKHYLNDENSFFYDNTVLKYKTSEMEMNPFFMTHNISLNINLALDYESLEKLINDFSKNIQDLKKEQKDAIAKYKSLFLKKKQSLDEFFLKENKNINYSKLLYVYDMLNVYSKEAVKKRFYKLTEEEKEIVSPNEYSKSEKKQKDFYLRKPMFLSYLNTVLGYKKLSKHIEREELNLRTIIEERYYLEMI